MSDKVWWRCEYTRCNKTDCKSCPHGPYWYSYRRVDGRMRKKYHGRVDPRPGQPDPDPWMAIFSRVTATEELARRILGVTYAAPYAAAKAAYGALCLLHHPDRGGDERKMACVNAAWSFLRKRHGW